ncbi:hypothetical protein NDU88_006702 [Pleurodeles waltl]|uniref:Uncharacterized protein n=1 Tax=Pleurodeles waltl TaxID=8319 RepID=A0AAV7SQE6_PLEWA|nr:hypothetical protein NDU88_006701 [Pleurodeles waltl]KAJ1166294.1 hypothetical protein NDU88_006702 [Pleurodeles waltl]
MDFGGGRCWVAAAHSWVCAPHWGSCPLPACLGLPEAYSGLEVSFKAPKRSNRTARPCAVGRARLDWWSARDSGRLKSPWRGNRQPGTALQGGAKIGRKNCDTAWGGTTAGQHAAERALG